ncbi:hypothetical protein V6N13_141538 [Hibiscus sabdariffa]|uniref:RING-type E3 ubiquitin transferase n=2 Tax=Hibiscus sabdariffa TaxID=183260 RepID=A0ABR2P543_9ROSI
MVISKYCRRPRQSHTSLDFDENRDEMNHDRWQIGSQGLDESVVKAITVCKFKKNEGLIEGTDCSVCLSEFMEDESLRLLPKCNHAFHVPCIDTWFKSHSTCPLCRANIVSVSANQPATTVTAHEGSVNVSVSAIVYPQMNEATSVIHDLESGVREEAVRDMTVLEIEHDGDRVRPLRRSVSMSSSILSHGQVMSIADILHISEEQRLQSSMGIGSSKQFDASEHCCRSNHRNGVFNLVTSPLAMKRSISTGRFMFPRFEKERNWIQEMHTSNH